MMMSGFFNEELLKADGVEIEKNTCAAQYIKLNKRILLKIISSTPSDDSMIEVEVISSPYEGISDDSMIEVEVISSPYEGTDYTWNFKRYLTDIKYHELDAFI